MAQALFPLHPMVLLVAALLTAACSNPEVEKRRHFERGNQYAADKKDEFAVVEYASAVKLDPKFGEARLKLAQTYERMNNPRAAFPEFLRAADALPDDRDAQVKATQVLLLSGRFEDAKAFATQLVTKNPLDVEALLLRANAMAALKDPAGAITEIEEALKVQAANSRSFLNLGAVRLSVGEGTQAEAAFRQAIALDPSSVDAQLALANYLWAAGRPNEAEQAITHALLSNPQHLLANRMLAMLYLVTQRPQQAEQPLTKVAEISKTPSARLQLADYYRSVGRMDGAKRLLNELAGDQSSFAAVELRLASIDYTEKRPTEAHKRLDGLLLRASGYAPALLLKAQWLTTENKLDEALEKARAAVAADPESIGAHFSLGVIHERRREVADAVNSFTEVLRLNPKVAEAQVALSRLNLAAGDPHAALQTAQEAKRIDPANAAARVALARSLLARGDLAQAETEISALAKSAPDSAVVAALHGSLEARRNNFDAAKRSFERSRELSPQLLDGLAGLVSLEIRAKQTTAALARVDTELAKRPDHPELLALAAQVHLASGQVERAEQALRHAVASDPRFLIGYAFLAQLYLQQQRLDDARAEFEAMVKRDPSAAAPRTMVGIILETQGNRAEAKRWYEKTVAAGIDAPLVNNNLAMIYAQDGTNLDIALQLITAAKQRLPDSPDVDDTLGWVYYKKDQASLAVRPLEESLKKRPDNAEALYHLGLTYAKLGNNLKARDALGRALKLDPQLPGGEIARRTLASLPR